ncbi:non-ribosomal peptide synthetase [Streptomyces sp. SID13588]|uniref:non-ribosomal peptide synthetase n=1 Tax=Streptomyces sp. SID13588 TaxID=2706051 RepID=UPI0013CD643D|nr:non-ribosomal peptide synthetase [Streptomyces sp. SID13588]NEA73801.1 non-ribosomal peptide synthetase [Streptomyces sp. SID13588]
MSDSELAHDVVSQWNATVAATPERTAIVDDGRDFSYAEVDARARSVTAWLLAAGVRPEDRVVLCAERGFGWLSSVLGILGSGAAFVPVNVHLLHERVAGILARAGARAAVVDDKGARLLTSRVGTMVNLCELREARAAGTATLLAPPRRTLAYVVFTSGSSGSPKGVMIEHAALGNTVREAVRVYGLNALDRVLQFSDLGFDTAFEEIFPVWAIGGAVVVRRPETVSSAAAFWGFCVENAVTVVDLTPAFWQLLVSTAVMDASLIGQVRLVILGGDRLAASSVAAWQASPELAARCRLMTSYGPTEAAIIVTAGPAAPVQGPHGLVHEIPIGEPIGEVDLRVTASTGELHISGVNLARGYLDDPRSTADRFRPNPHGHTGERVYLSGDIARIAPDGRITVHGRLDRQVKIRGYRVDLNEIELELIRLPAVQASAVCAVEDENGAKTLVAFVTGPDPSSATNLNQALRTRLPDYALPDRTIARDRLPLTDRGKIDYTLLVAEAMPGVAAATGSPAQRTVLGIMRELLDRPDLSESDDFFEAGGHSILSMHLVARLADELGVEVDLLRFFLEPTGLGIEAQIKHQKGVVGDGTD